MGRWGRYVWDRRAAAPVRAACTGKKKSQRCKCCNSWASNFSYSFPRAFSLSPRVIYHLSVLPPAVVNMELNHVGVMSGAERGEMSWAGERAAGVQPFPSKGEQGWQEGCVREVGKAVLAVNKRAEEKCSCAFLICTAGDFSSLMIYHALMLKR